MTDKFADLVVRYRWFVISTQLLIILFHSCDLSECQFQDFFWQSY